MRTGMSLRRAELDLRYCTGCGITTRHQVQETTCSCLRCGAVKYPVAPVIARAK